MPTTAPIETRPALPGLALSLGVTWLLAGAVYKLFEGNVADLPSTVLEHSPFDSGYDTFRYSIAAELAVVGLVIALPRFAWLLLAATFGVFVAALYPLWQEGAESCGCFGGTVQIRPEHMMLIDGGLMLFILVSRPWRMAKGAGLGPLAALAFVAAGVAAPLVKLEPMDDAARPAVNVDELRARSQGAGTETSPDAGDEDPTDAASTDVDATDAAAGAGATDGAVAAEDQDAADGPEDDVTPDADDTSTEEVAADEGADAPPAPGLPPFMQLDFENWTGQNVYELPFSSIANFDQGFIDANAHVVVYRQTCDVCQEHLENLQLDLQQNPAKWEGRPIVLMRIIEKTDTPENNVCVVLPEPSQKVTLPALEKGYLATTPITFDVDEEMNISKVTNVREELED